MRYVWLALAGGLWVGAASAQVPQPAAPFDPAHNRLDALLLRWEQELQKVDTLDAQIVRTTDDKTFQVKEVAEGVARYKKPNLALMELHGKTNPQLFEKYVCTGTYLYEFAPASKEIRAHELPPPKPGQVADDNFLSFLFGMKAETARQRYDLRLVQEDKYYIYIEVYPRTAEDKADFSRARLVLNNQTYLPRQLAFEQPNKNTIIWDLPRLTSGANINMADFAQPVTPPGWKMVRVPRTDPPPRVVRPNR